MCEGSVVSALFVAQHAAEGCLCVCIDLPLYLLACCGHADWVVLVCVPVCLCVPFHWQARRDKARDLLQRGWQPHMAQPKYDPEHALVLCRQHNYLPGLVLLYDKKRLHREVLAVYMEACDYGSLIAACVQYGDAASGETTIEPS